MSSRSKDIFPVTVNLQIQDLFSPESVSQMSRIFHQIIFFNSQDLLSLHDSQASYWEYCGHLLRIRSEESARGRLNEGEGWVTMTIFDDGPVQVIKHEVRRLLPEVSQPPSQQQQ